MLLFFKCSATLPNELSFYLYDSPTIVFLAKFSTTSQPDDGLQTKTRGYVNPRGAKCFFYNTGDLIGRGLKQPSPITQYYFIFRGNAGRMRSANCAS